MIERSGDRQYNFASAGGMVVSAQNGDIDVYNWMPRYQLDSLPLEGTVRQVDFLSQPSRLLAAANQAIDFYGRAEELAQLGGWRDDPATGFSIRLVHGRGGQGKTRLAVRFAELSTTLNWTVLRATHVSNGQTGPAATAAAGVARRAQGTLLIVDYADRWPLSDLLSLIVDPRMHQGTTRILLLARSSGGWWNSLTWQIDSKLSADTSTVQLAPLAQNNSERAHLFRAACGRFADLLGVPDSGAIALPVRLEQDAYSVVLTVHMAALAAVYAHADKHTVPRDPDALSAYLLGREVSHWHTTYETRDRSTRPEVLARAVYTALLAGPLPYEAAVRALAVANVASSTDSASPIIDDHTRHYPPADPGTVLEPLHPDRLGEDFFALQTPGHDFARYQADPWASNVAITLAMAVGRDEQLAIALPRLMSMLIETAIRWEHISQRQLLPLLRDHPVLALRAGGPILARLADLPDLDRSVLESIESILPTARHLDLDDAIATLLERLTDRLLRTQTDPVQLAELHHRCAERLHTAHRYHDALAHIEHAVAFRGLGYSTGRARSLSLRGEILIALRRDHEALDVLLEALKLWRSRPRSSSDDDGAVAAVHGHLASLQTRLGQHSVALSHQRSASMIWRGLPQRTHALAESCDAEATILARLHRGAEAGSALRQSIPLWRQLASHNPALYLPKLALAISRHSTANFNPAPSSVRLHIAEEAVDLYRLLSNVDASYQPHLLRALANLAEVSHAASNLDRALAAASEAIDIADRLCLINSTRWLRDKAHVLHLFARVCLSSRRQLKDALTRIAEAITILRGLPADVTEATETAALLLDAVGRTDAASKLRPPKQPEPTWATRVCPGCDGTGRVGRRAFALDAEQQVIYDDDLCSTCGGIGRMRVPEPVVKRTRCSECYGQGEYFETVYSPDPQGEPLFNTRITCSRCRGRGYVD